ncbi:MAG TPA: DUF4186 domain-containing protein [Kofleriaceae bacterium]|nr:DUF4186 domain-containing protein [Kofleriaceae bacterium]
MDVSELDARLDRIGSQRFRAKFHLRPGDRDRSLAMVRGPTAMRAHARELIAKRLAPAQPYKDGRQTPYRGHPVFVAQHATATCCRTCLAKHHGIAMNQELTADEQTYVVDVICRWIARELAGSERLDEGRAQ